MRHGSAADWTPAWQETQTARRLAGPEDPAPSRARPCGACGLRRWGLRLEEGCCYSDVNFQVDPLLSRQPEPRQKNSRRSPTQIRTRRQNNPIRVPKSAFWMLHLDLMFLRNVLLFRFVCGFLLLKQSRQMWPQAECP